MTAPHTMSARRARIAALVTSKRVGSQEDLGRLLADDGINVTQATLSRDLDAIGAVKVADGDGVHYVLTGRAARDTTLPLDGADQALAKAAQELLLGADAAQNIAVLHTPPGAAQYLAGHVDRSSRFDSVGSVAGDDTIILIMRTAKAAEELCRVMLGLAEARRAM